MTGLQVPTIAEVESAKRLGPFRIVKGHVEARRYRVLVLDMRRKTGDRQVYRAPVDGWTREQRENAAAWMIERALAEIASNRPAPRASSPEEENMAGKPDPKPRKAASKSKTSKTSKSETRKRPIPSDDVAAVDAAIRGKAASKPQKQAETTQEPTTETETTETQPEPIVELPARDEAPADLAASVITWAEEATEASIERVPAPSGAEERLRVNGTTVAYVAVGKRGVSVKVGLQSGKRERINVKTSDDVAVAGRSLAETLGQLAKQAAEKEEVAAK